MSERWGFEIAQPAPSTCGGELLEVKAPVLRLGISTRLYECRRCGRRCYVSSMITTCPRRDDRGNDASPTR